MQPKMNDTTNFVRVRPIPVRLRHLGDRKLDINQSQNKPPVPRKPLPFPLPVLVPMPGEKALVQKSVCHHRAYAASYDTLTDRIPDTTSLTTSLSHTTQYTPLQIHLHLFPLFSLLRSCAQPGERAYAAVSHNCSIFTLHTYTYTQVIPDLTGDNAVIPDLTGGLTGRGSRWITFIATAVLVIISYPISSLPTQECVRLLIEVE